MRLILCAAAIFGLVGCHASPIPAAAPETYEGYAPNAFTDGHTGCQYLVINNSVGSALTPRLASDGLPMCPNVKRETPNDHP